MAGRGRGRPAGQVREGDDGVTASTSSARPAQPGAEHETEVRPQVGPAADDGLEHVETDG